MNAHDEQNGCNSGLSERISLEEFRTELDVFSGPLDLLLYLIKRDEVDILQVPISQITDQYLQALRAMHLFNVNVAAEFTVMAATLMEMKSRSLLPESRLDENVEDDPEGDLVQRLLQYKSFKDAASLLAERARARALTFTRGSVEVLPLELSLEPEIRLEELSIWDLTSAYARLLQQTHIPEPAHIVYDEVPVAAYMQEILRRLQESDGRVDFLSFFREDRSRPRIVGMFLALLELTRQRRIWLGQQKGAQITITLRTENNDSPAAN